MTQLERIFLDAVCDSGSPVATCQCGRINYAAGGYGMTEGELENYKDAHSRDPENKRYHAVTDADAVSHGEFNGAVLVYGCPCEVASKFGNFLWGNRHTIAKFLRGMSDAIEADRRRLVDALPPETKEGE